MHQISQGKLTTAHKKQENPARKSHYEKSAPARIRKERQKRPDQKIPWPVMKATPNDMHKQQLSPLLNILPINYFTITVFGTMDKKGWISQ